MSKCNENSFLDDLKKKLDSIETPDFSAFENALSEAEAAVNDAIGDVTGFLNDAVKEANKSLQEMIGDLQNSFDQSDLAAKIAEIKKEFGEAVDDLDDLLDQATGGLSEAISKIQGGVNDFDSDAQAAVGNLVKSFTEGLNFPSPCDTVPNIEKDPETGQVAEKPKKPRQPTGKPESTKAPKVAKVVVTNYQVRNNNVADPLDDEKIKEYIKKNEGLRLNAYKDASGYSIGYGHFIKPNEQYLFNGITQAQAESIFEADYYDHRDAANSIPNFAYHPGIVRMVLIDMTFNMGNSWYTGFPKMMEALAKNDYNEAANQIVDSAYYTQVGRRAKQNVAYMRQAAEANKATTTPVEESQVATTETEQVVEETIIEEVIGEAEIRRWSREAVHEGWRIVVRNKQKEISKMYTPKRSYEDGKLTASSKPTAAQKQEKLLERAGFFFAAQNYHLLVKKKYGIDITPDHFTRPIPFTEDQLKHIFKVNGTYSEDKLWEYLEELNELHVAAFNDRAVIADGVNFEFGMEIFAKYKM